MDAFFTVWDDQTSSNAALVVAAQTFAPAATRAHDKFAAVASAAKDSQEVTFANQFADETARLAQAATDLVSAMKSQDQSAFTAASSAFDAASTDYSKTIDAYNAWYAENAPKSDDPAYTFWLVVLIVAGAFLGAALLLALSTRGRQGALPPKTNRRGVTTQRTLGGARRAVVVWSGVFVVGALVPFLQVSLAKPGSSYWVVWYPLVIGAPFTIIAFVQYLRAAALVKAHGSAPILGAAEADGVAGMGPG